MAFVIAWEGEGEGEPVTVFDGEGKAEKEEVGEGATLLRSLGKLIEDSEVKSTVIEISALDMP